MVRVRSHGQASHFGLDGVQSCSESCVTLGKLLAHSEPQLSHQRSVRRGRNTSTELRGGTVVTEKQPYGACDGYLKKRPSVFSFPPDAF